jgi:two-component system LytT family sensor kinase
MEAALSVSRPIGAMDRAVSATTPLSFWKLQAVGWSSFFVLLWAARLPNHMTRRDLVGSALAVGTMFIGSCMLRPICRAILQRPVRWLASEIRVFGWSLAVGAFWRFVLQLIGPGVHGFDPRAWSVGTLQFAIVLCLWCNLYFSITQWERLMRAETDARDARLAALRYQLNPHFLFNALNGVSTLVTESNAPAATRMLSEISDYLRATLDTNIRSEVPLSDEIALTDRYLAIEQSRLAGRLCIERHIDPDAWDAAVPSFLLQPLVENAVRHGIAPLIDGGTLGIRCECKAEWLCVTVRNSGLPNASNARTGIGLFNTAERLRVLYGADHHFALEWLATGGCQATVQIPFRKTLCVS